VDCTLPQASADISKTDSNRKEGVVYGFFAGEGAVSRVLSFVALSMFNPRPHALTKVVPIVTLELRSPLCPCPRHPIRRKPDLTME
jgi:hypothetical protein